MIHGEYPTEVKDDLSLWINQNVLLSNKDDGNSENRIRLNSTRHGNINAYGLECTQIIVFFGRGVPRTLPKTGNLAKII